MRRASVSSAAKAGASQDARELGQDAGFQRRGADA
jgi:hypothetical protein